jgi:hypothetical protein
MPRSDAQAAAQFTSDPKAFLRDNFVILAGEDGRGPGLTVFQLTRFGTRHGFGTIFHVHRKRTAWHISVSQNQDQGALAANELVAYYCPMRTVGTLHVTTTTRLPRDPVIRLMITG